MRIMKGFSLFTLLLFSFVLSQQIGNAQFTDMNGKSYDLHEVCESGKHVLIHFTFNS